MPDAIVVTDARGVIVAANRRCETVLGYAVDELVGRPVELLVPRVPDRHRELREAYGRAPTTRPMGTQRELTARSKSGEGIAVDIALSPLLLDDGSPGVVAAIRDARARSAREQQLRIQEVALDAAANGIVITDRAGIITWANPAVSRMTGYALDELIGANPRLLKSGKHDERVYRELWQTVLAGETWHGDIVNRRKDGSLYHEEQTIAPVVTADGKVTHFIAIKQDVTTRREAEDALRAAHDELARRVAEVEELSRQLREQAIRDPLTGLFNRRYLDETLARVMSRASHAQTPLSVVLLDVDHFKLINDHFGHDVGDRFLSALGDLLRAQTRAADVACRFGGEEFVVLMPGASHAVATRRANEWRRRFSELVLDEAGHIPRCTLSGGVVEWRGPDEPARSLLRRADEALYTAKDAGRNRITAAA